MPIVRSYMCPECAHTLTVTLTAEEWDAPPPICPRCNAYDFQEPMQQEFKPPGIINHSPRSKAEKITEDILAKDYNVTNMQRDHRPESTPTRVSYANSTWGVAREALEAAISSGRQTRLKHGSGLDILQQNLKSGAEPDLIELSKRKAMRVW